MPGLLDLPTDLLLAILEFAFVVEDILSLRQVSRHHPGSVVSNA
jgi:hypothetical protein